MTVQRPFFSSGPRSLTPADIVALSAGIARSLGQSSRRDCLEDWLVANDMTDQDFAVHCGLTRGYISRLRRNMVNPSLTAALAVRKATGNKIPIESLSPDYRKPTGHSRLQRQ